MNRKKIAILISGEIRTNSLGKGNNTRFVDTFKNNILNNDVLNNYDVNIFFVTDKIIEEKAYKYFGEHLKELLQLSFQDIDEPLNLEPLVNNYMNYYNYRKNNPDKFPLLGEPRGIRFVKKYYKVYAAYKLMKKYEKKHFFEHDYILNFRPDICMRSNFYNSIKKLENDNLEISLNSEFCYFGRYKIMSHICNLIFCYGKYNYGEIKHDTKFTNQIYDGGLGIDYLDLQQKWANCWHESPEVQLFECILEYCYLNNINYDKLYPYFCEMEIFDDRKTEVIWEKNIIYINYKMIQVPVCNGELVDKLTILEIKKNKMTGDKLVNVTKEYDCLYPYLEKIGLSREHELFKKLYEINLEFWEYHDWQRERWILLKDTNFIDIELFKRNRDEHILNDNRAKVKKEINMLTNSEIIEEKQFISYQL